MYYLYTVHYISVTFVDTCAQNVDTLITNYLQQSSYLSPTNQIMTMHIFLIINITSHDKHTVNKLNGLSV